MHAWHDRVAKIDTEVANQPFEEPGKVTHNNSVSDASFKLSPDERSHSGWANLENLFDVLVLDNKPKKLAHASANSEKVLCLVVVRSYAFHVQFDEWAESSSRTEDQLRPAGILG